MIDSNLIKEAIEDCKAVRHLCLSWTEGQFIGIMGFDDEGNVVRKSCRCTKCNTSIPLEQSASHASIC